MAATTSRPVVLLLGGGPNIGKAVIEYFSKQRFQVAVVSRSRKDGIGSDGVFNLSGDLSNPAVVMGIFDKVHAQWGPPTVVVYNAAQRTLLPANDPLSNFSLAQYHHDANVNVASALLACHFSIEGFKKLPPSPLKTFFYTGNKLKVMPSPKALTFGMNRAAMAHCIWDCSLTYRDLGYKFYFTDERFADGRPTREQMNGEVRAQTMLNLVEDPVQGPWYWTFVKDEGYVDFDEVDKRAERTGKWE